MPVPVDIVSVLRRIGSPDRVRTHYEGCAASHVTCACIAAADELERLYGEVEALYRAVDVLLDQVSAQAAEIPFHKTPRPEEASE